ncbi:MAG: pentapeptide repeat-containing protein, partial [Candidatus Marinimicrobia bacterium]|nr:pentapeptide repeat-containing protein [Candidatus Neomarinimicrobiota bacterium]
ADSKVVMGYIINGSVLVSVIESTSQPIRIQASRIEGVVDFSLLQQHPLKEDILPARWGAGKKEAFIQRNSSYYPLFRVVKKSITIQDSIFITANKQAASIRATNTIFHGSINFTNTVFQGKVNFRASVFSKFAGFTNTRYQDEAVFAESTFNGLSLSNARFEKGADFTWFTVIGWADFKESHFQQRANFGYANFRREEIWRGKAEFIDARFGGLATFSDITFDGELDFSRAVFLDDASFARSRFSSQSYFKEGCFQKSLIFTAVKFKSHVDFRASKISKLNFDNRSSPVTLPFRLDFRRSVISEAHFEDLYFQDEVNFSDVVFGGVFDCQDQSVAHSTSQPDALRATVMRYVTFNSSVYFFRTKFTTATELKNIQFHQLVDFTEAEFLASEQDANGGRFSLSHVNANKLKLRWQQLPHPDLWVNNKSDGYIASFVERELKEASQAGATTGTYEALSKALGRIERHFREKGMLDDANSAYFYTKKAELAERRAESTLRSWLMAHWYELIWYLTAGFGTRLDWVVGWILLVDLLFSLLYWCKGEINRQAFPEAETEFSFGLRLFDFPRKYLAYKEQASGVERWWQRLFDAVRFSTVVLLKIGRRDTVIGGSAFGINMKYYVWVEWLIGFYLLASLVYTLSNTMPIINSLISGAF